MRTAYHEELARFHDRLGDLAGLAEGAIRQATQAVLDNDIDAARKLSAEEETISRLHRLLDADAVTLIARQQPVASELRTIVAGLRMSGDLDRMGALARHIAEIVQRRHPRAVVPEPLRALVAEMGETAQRMAAMARAAMASRDPAAAAELDRQDNEMDRLETTLAQRVIECTPPVEPATAMDLALIGRFYERFGDHAVALAARVAYLVGPVQEDLTV
ncbi:phosphate signaling complex protein PhoU [Amycolatopsis sp. K13G38]|uniref:Phosphate-specific transport system accessory protein PhoU n=1 Tax=Amycolatopsis acididurans TaxID=2724524 RepID=A0ABX1IYL9_9PSEU|nr:phosphate signaling complex protein PhoU [Amycolatopsis acididurans]NKQ51834.1 phosphate signaling complex protein PhoU [Amycolatopsis acididurans]